MVLILGAVGCKAGDVRTVTTATLYVQALVEPLIG
jgi:hypothetical protein